MMLEWIGAGGGGGERCGAKPEWRGQTLSMVIQTLTLENFPSPRCMLYKSNAQVVHDGGGGGGEKLCGGGKTKLSIAITKVKKKILLTIERLV